jgi:hypothetical protein
MFKRVIGILVFMFLMAITIPVLAQRHGDSCNRRVGGRGYASQRVYSNYDNYRGDYGRRNNRRYSSGRGNGAYYGSAYYPQTYYASTYYVVRRPRPVRYYNNYGYRPRYRGSRARVSFSIGF